PHEREPERPFARQEMTNAELRGHVPDAAKRRAPGVEAERQSHGGHPGRDHDLLGRDRARPSAGFLRSGPAPERRELALAADGNLGDAALDGGGEVAMITPEVPGQEPHLALQLVGADQAIEARAAPARDQARRELAALEHAEHERLVTRAEQIERAPDGTF